jgi:hypothetical protein
MLFPASLLVLLFVPSQKFLNRLSCSNSGMSQQERERKATRFRDINEMLENITVIVEALQVQKRDHGPYALISRRKRRDKLLEI